MNLAKMSQISSTTKDRLVVSSPHSRYQELSRHMQTQWDFF
jgi:hypothetical protein